MNDTELDEMLNKWNAPAVPRGLRERISAHSPKKRRFSLPSGLFTAIAASAAVFLLAIGIASPQALVIGSVPFTVDSEFIRHNNDGSQVIEEYRTEGPRKWGGEPVTLSSVFPDSAFMTFHGNLIHSVENLLYPFIGEIHDSGYEKFNEDVVRNDCVWPQTGTNGPKVSGHETILGYPAVIIRSSDKSTEWRAPDLGCFVIQRMWFSESSHRITYEKRPLKITMNRSK
jgi:hypothetical protein